MVKRISHGTLVVVGGVNASHLAPQILSNHSPVDLVVAGDGEDTLWRLLEGHPYATVPNLWFRQDGKPRFSFRAEEPALIGQRDPWDYQRVVEGHELQSYVSRVNDDPTSTVPPGINLTRGCLKRDSCGPCIYCSCCGTYRTTPPEQAVAQIRHLCETHGVNYLFETGDNFAAPGYLRQLKEATNGEKLCGLRCYADPEMVSDADIAQLAADVGVYEVFLGFETADNDIARQAHKAGYSPIEKALANAKRLDISACIPVMFGLPGETAASAKATAQKVLELVSEFSIRMVLVSLAMPLAGSPWYEMLCQDPRIVAAYNLGDRDLLTDDDPDYLHLLELSLTQSGTRLAEIIKVMDGLRSQLVGRVALGSFGAIETTERLSP
jgi:radical SAM superfamily enzyme YgiQ (UPF0313 family)